MNTQTILRRLEMAMFDAPYVPLHWKVRREEWAEAHFVTMDGREGVVDFMSHNASRRNTDISIDVLFTINDNLEVTGKGDAFRIFATVLRAIDIFITQKFDEIFSEKRLGLLTFEVKNSDTNRSRLYARMIKRFAPRRGFGFTQRRSGEMDIFTLRKR